MAGDPDAPAARVADSAVGTFHEDFNHARYASICQAADANAFRSITALNCAEFLAYVRERLGRVEKSNRPQLPVLEDRPVDGRVRVAVHYATRFERDTGTEDFGWSVSGDKATLTSYRVSAAALSGDRQAR